MRRVALILALLTFASLVPATSANDCVTDPSRQTACIMIDRTNKPNLPAGPGVPDSTAWGTYYIFSAYGKCVQSPIGIDCRGVPATGGAGIPTCVAGVDQLCGNGGYTGVNNVNGNFGVIFQETNGLAGLQRVSFWPRTADRMILV